MRNSIQGPLLRTGNNSAFKALGETGYPVFKMAFQLREAIYRLDAGRDLARHLAVPQNDQGGDRTDWYSSFAGDVIPWSGATESERAHARQQFNEFQMAVQALSEQMLNTENSGAGGDRRVFAQLLKSVVHFPDDEFLYLVNGVLVITFWGFVHLTGEQRNPMHWLHPSSVPVQSAVIPLAQQLAQPASPSVHTSEVEARTRRWKWRWLLWLLLALLFLALLLGLLRGCVPSVSLPGVHGFSGEQKRTQTVGDGASSKNLTGDSTTGPGVNSAMTTDETHITSSTSLPEASSEGVNPTVDGAQADAVRDPAIAGSPAPEGKMPVSNAKEPETGPSSDAVPPETSRNGSQRSANVPNTVPPVLPAQGEPLTLPPALPDGPAQFLNGQWRVNGGIQDKLTGRPLQLQYNFDHGTGTVSVRQSNGVTCTGASKGSVQKGALNITNPEQMKCSDGSNFMGPTIACKSKASGHADCVGNNDGDKTFPLRMLQPNT